MSGRIKDAKVGEQPVSDFVGAVVNIAVAHFRAAALQRELEARAESIERALDLQKAALSAVAATMRADLQVQLNRRELNEVIDPYLSNTIPKKWIQTRREVLSATVTLESAEAAADAADKLRIAFVALAEGRFGVEDLPALLDDINRIVTLIEAVRGKEE